MLMYKLYYCYFNNNSLFFIESSQNKTYKFLLFLENKSKIASYSNLKGCFKFSTERIKSPFSKIQLLFSSTIFKSDG